MNLIWILLILLICVVLFLSLPLECNIQEGFYTDYGFYKQYCPSCGWRSRMSCSKCTNCGYCVTPNGTGECVPGDAAGPYFRSDCIGWEYSRPNSYYPYHNIFPVIQFRSFYPYYNYNLRKRWTKDRHGTRPYPKKN